MPETKVVAEGEKIKKVAKKTGDKPKKEGEKVKKTEKKTEKKEKKTEKKSEKKTVKKAEKKEDKKGDKKEEKEEKKLHQVAYTHVPCPPPSYRTAAFDDVDWTNRDQIIALFPENVKATLSQSRGKPLSKTVDVYPFNLKAPFGTNYLFYDAQLLLEPNKKQCLVGDAGTGKSTLFSELAKGAIKDFPKHLYVHHCKEIEMSEDAMSVIETVVRAHGYRNILLECEIELKKQIAADPAPSKSTLSTLRDNLDYINMTLQRIASPTAYDRASKMLRVLGFDEQGQAKSTNALSGGLRMRVALCAAFFIEADLLLLDEPTNHLDFPSVLWLENRLRGYRGSFVVVSHDRNLLQNVCTSVIQIEEKKFHYHNVGFAEYEKRRDKAYTKKAEDIDKFMNRYRNVDFSSPLAKEKAEKKAWAEMWAQRQILLAGKFTFPDASPLKSDDPTSPDIISLINVKDVTFSYNIDSGIWIFKDPINLNVTSTTRIGVMGPNGAGKSTLLKLITDKLKAVTGTVTRHSTAQVAYFAQHHVQDIDISQTPIEYMIKEFPHVEKTGLLRSHLAKVGIVGDKAETRMSSLSGGLRSCVCFAKITYVCPHLLIMDEPTNFLDLDSIDALIAATNKYKGALMLVSHNRGFLLKCAKQYLSVVPGKFEIFDDLKNCERATYQFIEEMEAGIKVGAQDLVRKNPSADASAKVRTGAAAVVAPVKKDGSILISASSAVKPVEKKVITITAEEKALVGQKCTAVWAADGGRYPAIVTEAVGAGKVEVQYNGYPDKAVVLIKDVVFPKQKK